MPRPGQLKAEAGDRLVDRVGLGVLATEFPDSLIEDVIEESGSREQRLRDLPAALMVRYVIALSLFPSDGYHDVMKQVKLAEEWLDDSADEVKIPATTAITKARDRLGAAPMKLLFDKTATPIGNDGTPGCFYRQWRVCAMDGTALLVPDTPENAKAFGKPGNDKGEGALPQIRVLGLVECGSRSLFGAGFGGTGGSKSASEQALVKDLLPKLGRGQLLLADRNFLGFEMFNTCSTTGADLLWRTKTDRNLPVDKELPDGSYLSHLMEPKTNRKGKKIEVRVIEYTLSHDSKTGVKLPDVKQETYRLVTTILDPNAAPAAELGALYAERWENENLFDEIKIHQQDARLVLRSRTPERVEQEVWGILLLHRALRKIIYNAAVTKGLDPDRVSFTNTVKVVRRQVVRRAVFPPR